MCYLPVLLRCSDAAVCNGRPPIEGGPGVFLAVPGVMCCVLFTHVVTL